LPVGAVAGGVQGLVPALAVLLDQAAGVRAARPQQAETLLQLQALAEVEAGGQVLQTLQVVRVQAD